MPEHAEVRVAAGQLHDLCAGRRLTAIEVSHPRTIRHQPAPELAALGGTTVGSVGAVGKWIVVRLDDRPRPLGIHLRMSGRLLAGSVVSGDPHVHARLHLDGSDGPATIAFRDPRTFGELRVLAADGPNVAPDLTDPTVTGASIGLRVSHRRIAAKAVLLDQRLAVSGVGSYLADEALHGAGIDPRRPASSLGADHWDGVLDHARRIATASAAVGGVTLADEGWLDLWDRPGRYGPCLRVHARETCGTCGALTEAEVVAGRRARWCPQCQC